MQWQKDLTIGQEKRYNFTRRQKTLVNVSRRPVKSTTQIGPSRLAYTIRQKSLFDIRAGDNQDVWFVIKRTNLDVSNNSNDNF